MGLVGLVGLTQRPEVMHLLVHMAQVAVALAVTQVVS
jgi:hypothetical protein